MTIPDTLAERVESVRSRIADAAREAGRDPGEITTVVVTKFHPVSLIRDLLGLGMHDIGENRHQEARRKAAALEGEPIRWHFVGQLQTKKARQVREYASVVHSVDRPSLIEALDDGGALLDCFVQVNLTDDPRRGGVQPQDLEAVVHGVLEADSLVLRGLMAVAPIDEEPRAAFARVRALSERLQRTSPEATSLSMGMSHDFHDAILEGATHLRIGTAITGIRPAHD